MDNESLAYIAKGTKRQIRDENLLKVAEMIRNKSEESSVQEVAQESTLSSEMVREFIKVTELDNRVKTLITDDLITSVDIAYRLSKLSNDDQFYLARYTIDNSLSSGEVRNIVKFKKDHPKMGIDEVVSRVVDSQNRKIYVAYLRVDEEVLASFNQEVKTRSRKRVFKEMLEAILSPEELIEVSLDEDVVILKVTKKGLNELRMWLRKRKIPLHNLATILISDFLAGQ